MQGRKNTRKIKHGFLGQRGTTLVELIVTFALIGMFMASATVMLSSTLRMFARMQATSKAITVSDTLLDKIVGEITAADLPSANNTDGYYFWLEPQTEANGGKSRWVVFRNRSKSPIAIFAAQASPEDTAAGKANTAIMGTGELFLRYYAMSSKTDQRNVQEIDWHYDERVYMGYTIQDMWFSRENVDEHPNVIRVDLILQNPRTGFEYAAFRYAENYNYDFASNYMCERTETEPGITSFPVEAEEFRIKGQNGGTEEPEPKPEPKPEPEPEPEKTVGYTLYFLNEKKESIRPSETRTGVIGTQVQITLTPDGNDEMIQIIPPDIENYEFEASKSSSEIWLDELEDKNNLYLYYKLVNTGNSITVTDSDGNKHTLYTNLDWEIVKSQAMVSGYRFVDKRAWLMGDESGFYMVIYGSWMDKLPGTSSNLTLDKAVIANKFKITEDTRLLTDRDLLRADQWKQDKIPKSGDLAYVNGRYYFAGNGVGEWVVPPQESWVFIPQQ